MNSSNVRTVSRFFGFFLKMTDHYVNCDGKRSSRSIVKNGAERQIQSEIWLNVEKPKVLRQSSTDVRATDLKKMMILPRSQSLRLNKRAFRRGNLAPLHLKCAKVLTVWRLRNIHTLKHRTVEHFLENQRRGKCVQALRPACRRGDPLDKKTPFLSNPTSIIRWRPSFEGPPPSHCLTPFREESDR